MSSRNSHSHDPRLLAANAIRQIWQGETLLDESLFRGRDAPIRARALRLSREALRHETGLTALIRGFASKNPKPLMRAFLLLASYELKIEVRAAHAVVNEYTNLAKTQKDTRQGAGFLNAILRKIDKAPYAPPAVNNGFGDALGGKLRAIYGKALVSDMGNALLETPSVDIRLKSALDLAQWAEVLGGEALFAHHSIRIPAGRKLSDLEGYEAGDWWIQDAAASIAVDCFSTLEGKTALDLCAAPGGKTMQLADAGAQVTAVELNAKRAKRIGENLSRVKLEAKVIVADATKFDDGQFSRILVDAPCSASGTFRRHPDLKYGDALGRAAALAPLQAEILDEAFARLETGGELIYCTCSLLPEEGEAQIERFLAKESRAKAIAIDAERFHCDAKFAPYLRSFPTAQNDSINRDGFFIAKLTKAA